ncbi:hypothetical protein TNCT_700831 [Trichonephila clavata]|uniref:Uncharacterized protein n=1 Tax=Trichonephila clavata TaxID=2740835 RepID=A0A8X6L494_TRICU|nr:hypothetical protein TNCT_700831 [Trichonephila clavata]
MQKAEARFMVHRQRGLGSLGCLTGSWKCPSVKREPVSSFSLGLSRIHQDCVAGPPAYITGPITPRYTSHL